MAAPLKVLILHMRYHPDPTGTGLIVTQLAEALARYGARVRVITGHPHYAQTEAVIQTRIPLLDRLTRNGVEIWRTYTYVPPNPSIFHRAIGYLSYTFLSTFAAAGYSQSRFARYAMFYRQSPLPIFRLFESAPAFAIFRGLYWLLNLLVGRWGNKMAAVAERF